MGKMALHVPQPVNPDTPRVNEVMFCSKVPEYTFLDC